MIGKRRVIAGGAVLLGALASVAVAAAVGPFWYWTPKQANRTLVWANPQGLPMVTNGDASTILRARCAGEGKAKRVRHVRRFHVFKCAIVVRDDSDGSGPTPGVLWILTSKTRRNGVACWADSRASLRDLGCP